MVCYMQSVVLVTGAARGLGKEVARLLTASGHHVVIGARDAGQAVVAAEEGGAAAPPVAPALAAHPSRSPVAAPQPRAPDWQRLQRRGIARRHHVGAHLAGWYDGELRHQ